MKDINMLIVASQDTGVGLWSVTGQLIGKFGQHTWSLSNQLTWQPGDSLDPVRNPAKLKLCAEF